MIRRGFTLLETMIALAIFMGAMTIMMNGLIGVSATSRQLSANTALINETQRIQQAITRELSCSGWYLPNGYQNTFTTSAGATIADRDALYYPYVQVQRADDASLTPPRVLGTQFNTHKRLSPNTNTSPLLPLTSASKVNGTPPPGIPWAAARADQESHYLLSRELIYLKPKSAASLVNFQESGGSTYTTPNAHAALGIKTMSDLYYLSPTTPPIVIRSLYARPTDTTSQTDISSPIRWETLLNTYASPTDIPTMTTATGTNPPTISPASLCEYSLVVIPNEATKKGQLVRAKKMTMTYYNSLPTIRKANTRVISIDSTKAFIMVQDLVISEMVDRIVFDTFRTSSTVQVGQIRVRVFLSQSAGPNSLPAHLTAEFTVALRSTSDANSLDALGTALSLSPKISLTP